MKKLFLFLVAAVGTICLLSSCNKTESVSSTKIKTDFSSGANVEYNGNYSKCTIKNDKEKGTEFIIDEPEAIRGYTINISNDKNFIEFKDLHCETHNLPIEENSYPISINRILKDIEGRESLNINNKDNSVCGECDGIKYTVFFDPSSREITKITSPSLELNVELTK